MQDYLYRQSDRSFLKQSIPLGELGSCLFSLSRECRDRQSVLRLCGVDGTEVLQVYLYLKQDAVEDLPAGIYRYSPDHTLELISEDVVIEGGVHGGVNREIFEQSAFSLYFVGRLSAVETSWRQWAPDLLLLEAGGLGQNLMMTGPIHSIGLCAIGSLNFEMIRPLLGATAADGILLHSFCGGRIVPRYRATTAASVNAVPGQPRESVDPGAGKSALPPSDLLERVRAFLSERLPEYMIPTFVMELKEMPLTSNGKVARNALPPIEAETGEQSAGFVAPSNPIEQRFAEIWRTLLGKERIGIHDNFFSLGGDSVKGIQFLTRVRQEGMEVVVREFFTHPTIAELAKLAVGTETKVPSTETAETKPSEAVPFPNADLGQDELDELIKEFGSAEKTA